MDIDDDSGWLRIEPINPFACSLNDEGEEVGYRKVHLQLCDVAEKVHNFCLNKPQE